jgi:hypothetical protein
MILRINKFKNPILQSAALLPLFLGKVQSWPNIMDFSRQTPCQLPMGKTRHAVDYDDCHIKNMHAGVFTCHRRPVREQPRATSRSRHMVKAKLCPTSRTM